MPESGALSLILHAQENPELPHFLILDEMNLSHVERYFADFLSAMESGDEMKLHDQEEALEAGDKGGAKIPARIAFPNNLFVIGTVNIDETTYMFSPKVLDRASAIEFRVTEQDMASFLGNPKPVDLDVLKGEGASMAGSFLDLARGETMELSEEEKSGIRETLKRFFSELKKVGAEFGYRSAGEMIRLIAFLGHLDSSMSADQKMDVAIVQKMLPKLHGSRRKLQDVLSALGKLCVEDEEKDAVNKFPQIDETSRHVRYPLSLEKIQRMYRSAEANGFASFAEA